MKIDLSEFIGRKGGITTYKIILIFIEILVLLMSLGNVVIALSRIVFYMDIKGKKKNDKAYIIVFSLNWLHTV